jgi:predicted helicase
VYGVLHAPTYRERFANDLAKALPRIPMVADFGAFAQAGRDLAALHLGYETCAEYPLEIVATQLGELQSHHFRLGKRAMRFADDDRTVLIVNDHVRLAGVPPEAHRYAVNGRTPIEWFIDRYRLTRDRESSIVNDPNGWFSKPEDLVAAIRRIVHVSVETVRIVGGLPQPFSEPYSDHGRT